MISQHWINTRGRRINTLHHTPEDSIPTGTVILLPGFSHAMCDMDYFMSRLARQLVCDKFFVVQADLRGHVDSPYPFSAVDLCGLREDIQILIHHYMNRTPGQLFCVGRGLTATLLATAENSALLTGVAGVAPYCLDPQVTAGVFAPTLSAPEGLVSAPEGLECDVIDAYAAFPGNDYVGFSDFSAATLSLLNALGALSYNLHGMEISRRLLEDLAHFDPLPVLQKTACCHQLWIFDDEEARGHCTAMQFKDKERHLSPARYQNSIPAREPLFQSRFIAALHEWLLNISSN